MRNFNMIIAFSFVCLVSSFTAFSMPTDPVTFSFASDDYDNGPTFRVFPGHTITANARLDLFIDLNHDFAGGKVQLNSIFRFKGETYDHGVVPYGAHWLHSWRVRGEFQFLRPGGAPILTAQFSQAVLSSISPSFSDAGDTLTLQDSELIDPNMLLIPHAPLFALGIMPNDLHFEEDFAFTFTSTKPVALLIPLGGAGEFLNNWTSEGSFSASAVRKLP